MTLFAPVVLSAGDTLSIKLSVRAGATGHRSGTARLWSNDSAANSRFGATIGGASVDFYLLEGFGLGTSPGPGPKRTIDVFVDRAAGGNPFLVEALRRRRAICIIASAMSRLCLLVMAAAALAPKGERDLGRHAFELCRHRGLRFLRHGLEGPVDRITRLEGVR